MPSSSETVKGSNPWGTIGISSNSLMISKDNYKAMQTAINNFYSECEDAVTRVNDEIPSSSETAVISDISRASFSHPGNLNLTFGNFVDASTFNSFIDRIYNYNPSAKSNMVTLLKKYTPPNKNSITTNNTKVYKDDTIVAAEIFNQLGMDAAGMRATFTASWTKTDIEPEGDE